MPCRSFAIVRPFAERCRSVHRQRCSPSLPLPSLPLLWPVRPTRTRTRAPALRHTASSGILIHVSFVGKRRVRKRSVAAVAGILNTSDAIVFGGEGWCRFGGSQTSCSNLNFLPFVGVSVCHACAKKASGEMRMLLLKTPSIPHANDDFVRTRAPCAWNVYYALALRGTLCDVWTTLNILDTLFFECVLFCVRAPAGPVCVVCRVCANEIMCACAPEFIASSNNVGVTRVWLLNACRFNLVISSGMFACSGNKNAALLCVFRHTILAVADGLWFNANTHDEFLIYVANKDDRMDGF